MFALENRSLTWASTRPTPRWTSSRAESGTLYGDSPHRNDEVWLEEQERKEANRRAQQADYLNLTNAGFEFKYGLTKQEYLLRRDI